MTTTADSRTREAFYRAAVVGLRALDARERVPRRFGPDADARWAEFHGALGASDRIDILLRDAAGTWGAAFSPAAAFGAVGLADDEPFGPEWEPLSEEQARRVLALAEGKSLDAAASALGVSLAAVDVPPISPNTRLAVAGGAAVLAVARRFAASPELSWSDQVLVVATSASVRQLGALAAVLLGARARTVLVSAATGETGDVRPAGFVQIDAALVSPDANPADASLACRLAAGG